MSSMRKPRALRSGDRVAVLAPASPFDRELFDQGVEELRVIGFEPVFDESIFARRGYLAGPGGGPRFSAFVPPGATRRSPESSRPVADTAARRCCRC